ncbi:HlyD family efflux transporter periplasmic adaptor subunit [Caminibacter mediatlanticus TB-2]|uniref:HlyD family efflux transporter periplasmic adaptor subunit n=1 Tax=Caminibacter mediatlanticus TB-2 TaxID=391592 RepID=A0ABX5VAC3_9BACT|nr:efflux RND transporter periplasmic adaptor subunit [Caminibacter mediatlanticus]QCT93975.1 HlyD family efflux transporter periplasmic adaptor subunit [Caminibacter mediatlanticus TB-2]
MQIIKKYGVIFLVFSLFVIGAFFIYQKLNPKKLPTYLVEAVGFVDGDLIHLNTKYPGRVEKIYVKAGDNIKKGEVLTKLNSQEFLDKLKVINEEIKSKEKELEFASKNLNLTIKEANLNINAKLNEIKALNYQIDTLKAVIKQDKKDLKRIEKLVLQNKAPHHKLELSILKLTKDKNELNALIKKRDILNVALNVAKTNLTKAKTSYLKIKALSNGINALKAKRDEIKTIINELTLKSPINGYVESKIANEGEVIGAGGVVLDLIDPSSFYLKVYVDTLTNDKIRLGQKAEIFLDSDLNSPIPAKVVYISKKAEFTPKEVAVRSDRITRVYEVWLRPLKPDNRLKLGLPAIGVILLDNNKTLPKTLKGLPVL